MNQERERGLDIVYFREVHEGKHYADLLPIALRKVVDPTAEIEVEPL